MCCVLTISRYPLFGRSEPAYGGDSMTGESSRREKAQAVLFSLIMVVSMVGIGAAGFAGSAAAQTTDSNIANGSVIADGADTGENAKHIFRTEVSSGDLGDGNLRNITINYSSDSGVDLAELNDVSDSTTTTVDGLGNADDIDVYIDGAQLSGTTATSVDLTTEDSNTTLIIGDDSNDLTSDTSASSLSTGSTVTVVLGDASGLTNPSSSTTADVTIGEAGSSTDTGTIQDMDLALGADAPIQAYDNSGSLVSNDTVLSSAASEAGAQGDLEISGDVDNVDPTGGSLSIANEASVDGNITSVGSSTPTIRTSIENQRILTLTSNTVPQTLENVDIEAVTPTDSDPANNLIQLNGDNSTVDNTNVNVSVSSGTATVANAVFDVNDVDQEILNSEVSDNFVDSSSGDKGLLAVQAGGSGERLLVDGNTFDTSRGVYVVSPNTTVSNNVFNVSGSYGVTTENAAGTAADDLVVSNNEFYAVSGDSGLDAIRLFEGDNQEVTDNLIDGNSDEFERGIELDSQSGSADALGNVTISGSNEIYNVSADGVKITDTGEFKSAPVTVSITGLTVDSSATNGIDIDLDDSGNAPPDVEVQDSTLDQAGTGILLNSLDSNDRQNVTVNNAEINGSSSAGLDIGANPANADRIEVTDSTFTNNAGGLNVSGVGDTEAQLNVHFNTFESNTNATYVNDGSYGANTVLNLTFNDFVDNEQNGLAVNDINGNGPVNANYSWWDNRDYSRIVGPYTLQNAGSQLPSPRRVYEYTRLHTGGQP
jgi:surface glycoprotein (TIGR04207 family)